VAEERRRQEALRRRALLRRLAAERAARAAARAGAWSGGAGAPLGRRRAGGPSAYDCSGLVMAAYRRAGVWLPRVSREQWNAGPHVGLDSLAPGHLVFFTHNVGAPSTIHHVGMYLGDAMIEAPYSGASVRIASIGRGDYIGAVHPTG
jgi:cell wall-associated NlpC family hydrolase